jgi:hypothetical protein
MLGCSAPDPRSVEGVIELLAAATQRSDAAAVYPLLDRRARSALNSIALDRSAAARLIAADYPEPERAAALRSLGDAARVSDPRALFVRRCPERCLAEIAARLAAPAQQRTLGVELEVTTLRGTTLRFHRDREGRVGLVWHTRELDAERLRANRERAQIAQNAEVYRRRRALENGAAP